MPNNLVPLNIDLPATNGLSSEAFAGGLNTAWAQNLDNVVFDDFGRLCAREAFRLLTSSPISGNPSMTSLFEYVKDTASTFIISVDGDNKNIYHGTGTLNDITGSFVISDPNMQWANFEGEVIGVGQAQDPIYWDGSAGSVATLHSKIDDWQASTAYVQGDIVKAVGTPSTTEYYVCSTAGTSGGSEPSFNTIEAATTNDNTAVWTTVIFPRGRCILSAYGRTWILRDDRTTIDFSALGVGYDFSTLNGGGTIDTKAILGRNDDFVTGIATFNNHLVIFSRFNVVIFNNIQTPTDLAIIDQIVNTGCIARDTIQNIGNDLVFLSYQGLRSLSRTIELEKVPLQDLSVNFRNAIINDIKVRLTSVTDDSDFKSVYDPVNGMYVLKIQNSFYNFDFKKSFIDPKQFVQPRITTWSSINFDSVVLSRDGTIYMAKAGAIGDYSGYEEWGLLQGIYQSRPYLLNYRSAWVDFGQIDPSLVDRTKITKKVTGDFVGGSGYKVDFTLAYDFSDNTFRREKLLQTSDGDEWSVGEWGVAEWSGTTEKRFAMVNHQGSGDHIQFGIDVNIAGARFCIQNLTLFVKLARTARGSARAQS